MTKIVNIDGVPCEQLGPGVYVSADGALHLVMPELLTAAGYADTPENRDTLTAAALEVVRAQFPTTRVETVD
jgi:hypothetical protein